MARLLQEQRGSQGEPAHEHDPQHTAQSDVGGNSDGPHLILPPLTEWLLPTPAARFPETLPPVLLLQTFLGKVLRGKRCRLTASPTSDDAALAAPMGLDIDNSFENATAVQQRLGWTIIKGWGVYELQREPAAASPAPSLFVAHKRWWNAKPSGVWVDLTPRIKSSEQLILIESQLADKQAHFLSLTHSSHMSQPHSSHTSPSNRLVFVSSASHSMPRDRRPFSQGIPFLSPPPPLPTPYRPHSSPV